jgi:TonB family protein
VPRERFDASAAASLEGATDASVSAVTGGGRAAAGDAAVRPATASLTSVTSAGAPAKALPPAPRRDDRRGVDESTPLTVKPVALDAKAIRVKDSSISTLLYGSARPASSAEQLRADLRDVSGLQTLLPAPAAAARPGAVLTAAQVSKVAALLPGSAKPDYPDALRASGVQGEAVASFIVDSNGRVDPSSFSVTRADNALFAAAVRQALPRLRFLPAELDGRPVSQRVEMRFNFTAPK